MNLFTKQKQIHRHRKQIMATKENKLWLLKGKGEGINQECGINRYTLIYIKQINKDLLQSTGNYIHNLEITYNEKESEKIYACITESLCCTLETNTIR